MNTRSDYRLLFIILGILSTMGGIGIGRFGYPILLPAMSEALSLNRLQAGALYSANLAGYLTFTLIGGLLTVRYRAKPVIVLSMAVGGLALMLTGLIHSPEWAVVWRFVNGLGTGGTFVPMFALVTVWFRPRRRGMAAGAMQLGAGAAVLLIGVLLPLIIRGGGEEGWRYGWMALGGIGVGVAIVLALLLRDAPPQPSAMEVADDREARPKPRNLPVVESAETRTGVERQGEHPQDSLAYRTWSDVLRSFNLWHLSAIHFCFGFTHSLYATFFSAYLLNTHQITLAQAGAMWASHGVVSASGSFVWGAASDFLGRKYALALNFCFFFAAAFLFLYGNSAPVFYLSAILFGSVANSPPAIMAAASGDYFGRRMATGAFTVITLFSAFGQLVGPIVGGGAADLLGSVGWVYWLSMTGAVAGASAALLLARPREQLVSV